MVKNQMLMLVPHANSELVLLALCSSCNTRPELFPITIAILKIKKKRKESTNTLPKKKGNWKTISKWLSRQEPCFPVANMSLTPPPPLFPSS